MLIVTFYHYGLGFKYTIYKLYHKKFSLQQYGIINPAPQPHSWWWQTYNSQDQLTDRQQITARCDGSTFDYQAILTQPQLTNYEFKVILHKISCGGDDYQGISLLNEILLPKLAKYTKLAPHSQAQDLALAAALLKHLPQAKHYACFDNGFHATIELNQRILSPSWDDLQRGYKNHGTLGLAFAGISLMLQSLADKTQAKGKWLCLYLSEAQTTLCALKNGKSIYCSSSGIHHELPSCQHPGLIEPSVWQRLTQATSADLPSAAKTAPLSLLSLAPAAFSSIEELLRSNQPQAKLVVEYYIDAICQVMAKLVCQLHGLTGIIFCGPLGNSNPRVRELLCERFSWLGAAISLKSNQDNQTKLHKKSSSCLIFNIKENNERAMLSLFNQRI